MAATTASILLVLLVIVPGVLIRRTYLRGRPQERLQGLSEVAYFVALAALWHASLICLSLPVIDWAMDEELRDHVTWTTLYVLGVLVIGPAVVAHVAAIGADYVATCGFPGWALRTVKALRLQGNAPQAWDFAWQEASRTYRWVIVRHTDGSAQGGLYSDRSWVSLSPNERDIFLEEPWEVDGGHLVGKLMSGVTGVWIAGDTVKEVIFITDQEVGDAQVRQDASSTGMDQEGGDQRNDAASAGGTPPGSS